MIWRTTLAVGEHVIDRDRLAPAERSSIHVQRLDQPAGDPHIFQARGLDRLALGQLLEDITSCAARQRTMSSKARTWEVRLSATPRRTGWSGRRPAAQDDQDQQADEAKRDFMAHAW